MVNNSFQSWIGNQIFVTSQRAQLQCITDTPPRWAKTFMLVFIVTTSSSRPEFVHEVANTGLNLNCLCWGSRTNCEKLHCEKSAQRRTFDAKNELRNAWEYLHLRLETGVDRETFHRSKAEPAEAAKVLENQISASRGSVTDARRRQFDAKHFQSGAFWGLQRSGRPPSRRRSRFTSHSECWMDEWCATEG